MQAEHILLGSILLYPEIAEQILLDPGDWFVDVHRRVHEVILAERAEGRRGDLPSLFHRFNADPSLETVGGFKYLSELAGGPVTKVAAADHARLITDLAARRRLIAECEDAAAIAENTSSDATPTRELISALGHKIDTLLETDNVQDDCRTASSIMGTIAEIAAKAMAGEAKPPVRTGIHVLDSMLKGGLIAPDLVILGGRPSMGKTAMAECIAWAAAERGQGVAFFSLEMSAEQLMMRAVQRRVGVPADLLRSGQGLTQNDISAIVEEEQRLHDLPLVIVDRERLRPSDIRSRVNRIRRRQPVDLVIVDQLNLMRPDEPYGRSTYETLSGIVRSMQGLAKRLDVPLLLLCQLSRSLHARTDRRPQLSDLRDTGAIEEAGRVIIFLHREEYYLEREKPDGQTTEKGWQQWDAAMAMWRGKAEAVLAKHHMAPAPARQTIGWDAGRQRFYQHEDHQ